MCKLLTAGFFRLWKDKIFWICMGIMCLYSLLYMRTGCRHASLSGSAGSLDEYYFHFTVSIGIFCAMTTGMFIGTEYSGGTLRNKIVTGHRRRDIYLSNFICVFCASLLLMAVWLATALVAVPQLGVWKMGAAGLSMYLLAAVLQTAAFCAMFTCVGMLFASRTAGVVLSIFLFLGLLLYAFTLYGALSQPEMTSSVEMTLNGIEIGDPVPNPYYVSGLRRGVYELLMDVLPTGQGILMWQLEIHPLRMMLSSVIITLVITAGGLWAFNRKKLK